MESEKILPKEESALFINEPVEVFIDNWYKWLKVRMPSIFEMWTKIALTESYKKGVHDCKSVNQKMIDELNEEIRKQNEKIERLNSVMKKAFVFYATEIDFPTMENEFLGFKEENNI